MQLHLDEIATKVALGAHAIILLDQAGWHGAKALVVPNNELPPGVAYMSKPWQLLNVLIAAEQALASRV